MCIQDTLIAGSHLCLSYVCEQRELMMQPPLSATHAPETRAISTPILCYSE